MLSNYLVKKALKPKSLKKTKNISSPKPITQVKSTKALADFMKANANDVAVSPDPETPNKANKLLAFMTTASDVKEASGAVEAQEDYDDYSESYYSDEGYEKTNKDEEFLNSGSFVDKMESHDYFNEQTKHISEPAKRLLSEKFMKQEIDRLCQVIEEIGETDDSGNIFVTYGNLREEYSKISDGLNGVLIKAKNSGRIEYTGSFLMQEDDAETKIYIL